MNAMEWKQLEGCWQSAVSPRDGVTAFVMRRDKFFENPDVMHQYEQFLNFLGDVVLDSVKYAINSPYGDDIAECGGLMLNSVQWEKPGKYRLWFDLGVDTNRMLAVSAVAGTACDVFCDPPS